MRLRTLCIAALALGFAAHAPAAPHAASVSSQFHFLDGTEETFRVLDIDFADQFARLSADWILGVPTSEGYPVGIGSQLVLSAQNAEALDATIAELQLRVNAAPFPGIRIIDAADPYHAAALATQLSQRDDIQVACPILKRRLARYDRYASQPNDPYFEEQLYLENRNRRGRNLGIDLNIRAAWPYGMGERVSIGIGDDGIDTTHPDLAEATENQFHFDFINNESHVRSTPPTYGFHGAAVAGIAAARGSNEIGMAGVAPLANLTALVILGEPNGSPFDDIPDFADSRSLAEMFEYQSSRIEVQNHSWGSGSTGLSRPGALVEAAYERGATFGRNGRGIVYVRAGGNSRQPQPGSASDPLGHPGLGNVNDDLGSSNPYFIAVAAVGEDGRAASYSSPGAPLLVAAPSGDPAENSPNLFTTDLVGGQGGNTSSDADRRPDYLYDRTSASNSASSPISGFNGTSAAAPQIAGLAATLLSINSRLTYRDIQQILAISAKQRAFDPRTQLNAGGFAANENVGFGVPDAGYAAFLASEWDPRPDVETKSYRSRTDINLEPNEFQLELEDSPLADTLETIPALPFLGAMEPLTDDFLPLSYVGLAGEAINEDLSGRIALIRRGDFLFREKITNAAEANAVAAIIFNNDGDETVLMAETDYSEIPAIFIGQSAGEGLEAALAARFEVNARFAPPPHVVTFDVEDPMICEQVSVRVRGSIANRSRLRILLESPSGVVSELQTYNRDTGSLTDWTYYSCQHFFEPSLGPWTVSFTNLGGAETIGNIQQVDLEIRGVEIKDTDADGLDDDWERDWFDNLDQHALDDFDDDGFHHMLEQVANRNPTQPELTPQLNTAIWRDGFLRLSWPARNETIYSVQTAPTPVGPFSERETVEGVFPVTDVVVPIGSDDARFYRIVTP